MRNLFVISLVMVFSFIFISNSFAEEVRYEKKVYTLNRMIAQHYTIFDPKKKARTTNIKRANSFINAKIIMPGEVVSFNRLVGPRVKEAGFMKAASYSNGKLTSSVGGGICQVASTWSAATMKLNLQIIERHAHSLSVSYITSDKEAAVAYGFKDFRFKNTSNNILCVKCFVIQDKLYVEYWRCTEKKEA